jgi:hypothetical protein
MEMSVICSTLVNRVFMLPAKECQVLLTADVWLQYQHRGYCDHLQMLYV